MIFGGPGNNNNNGRDDNNIGRQEQQWGNEEGNRDDGDNGTISKVMTTGRATVDKVRPPLPFF